MSISRTVLLAVPAALLLLALPGCEDPAANKPKATVSSAAPAADTKGASSASAAALGAPLDIDTAGSSIGFTGSKVTGKHVGTFGKFSGKVQLAGGKAEGGKITIDIDTSSVKTDAEGLDKHLNQPDFFDTAKFPKASFVSSAVKAGGDKGATHTITGELELRGVKKTVSFPATITVTGDSVTSTAEFSINRKDFGIVIAGKTDDLIRDDVLLNLSIKATKK